MKYKMIAALVLLVAAVFAVAGIIEMIRDSAWAERALCVDGQILVDGECYTPPISLKPGDCFSYDLVEQFPDLADIGVSNARKLITSIEGEKVHYMLLWDLMGSLMGIPKMDNYELFMYGATKIAPEECQEKENDNEEIQFEIHYDRFDDCNDCI